MKSFGRKSLIVLAVLFSNQIFADHTYYPSGFLTKLSNPGTTDFKVEVFKLLTFKHLAANGSPDTIYDKCPVDKVCYQQVTNMTYSQARTHMFGDIDLRQSENGSDYIRDVYCHIEYDKTDGVGKMRIPNPDKLNCEHTWPQSRFSKNYSSELQKTDLHHLHSTQNRANSVRGNYIFAEVDGAAVGSDCRESYFGTAKGTSITAFEPPEEHKGNVARALFYFSSRYQLPISELEEGYLRAWHAADPVDEEELQRNERIFGIQKNRNPFVEYPQLVNLISDF